MRKLLEILMWLVVTLWVIVQAVSLTMMERGDRIIALLVDIVLYTLIAAYYLTKE